MADFANDLSNRQPIDPSHFATLNRMPGETKWEDSVQYDRWGRGKVTQHIRATFSGRLRSETPVAGFVGNAGLPCREHTNGARPVWIWWAEVDREPQAE